PGCPDEDPGGNPGGGRGPRSGPRPDPVGRRDAGAGGGVIVRRTGIANADGGAESFAYSDDSLAWPGTPGADRTAPGGGQRNGRDSSPAAKAPWSGGGGRWAVWPLRIVLWAALLI